MDMSRLLLRVAASRPHVLLAVTPGGTAVRLEAERQLRGLGWPLVATPADADVLLVAGPWTADLTGPLEETIRAMPAPRVRAQVGRPAEVSAVLQGARHRLATFEPRDTGDIATPERRQHWLPSDSDAGDGDERSHSGGPDDQAGHDTPDTGHANHDMDAMRMPAGLPMADRGEDRDGLRLDRLHVTLGPLLADWPAGLVMRVTLQGDVIQQAHVEMLAGADSGGAWWTTPWRDATHGVLVTTGHAARWCAAAHLDSLGRFLAVAGWPDAVVAARRLRDELLLGVPAGALRTRAARFARRVSGSWTLRWSSRGLGFLPRAVAGSVGVSGPALRADGDVVDRYRQWLAEIIETIGRIEDASPLRGTDAEGPRGRLDTAHRPSAGLLEVLPRLVVGAELAAARLIVASLDPDIDELAENHREAARG